MKRFGTLLASVALAVPPAVAAPSSVGSAVGQTAVAYCQAAASDPAACAAALATAWTYYATNPSNLVGLLANMAMPNGTKIGSGFLDGAFNGGGASGEWTPDTPCANWTYAIAPDGSLIVPGQNPKGGGKTYVNQTLFYSIGTGFKPAADSADAVLKYYVHSLNTGIADQRDWYALVMYDSGAANQGRWYWSNVPRYKDGALTGRVWNATSAGTEGNYQRWLSTENKDCPQDDGSAGGDADYYPSKSGANWYDICITHAKTTYGWGGYALAKWGTIDISLFPNYINAFQNMNKCVLSVSLIRRITEQLAARARTEPSSPVPATPVKDADVKTCAPNGLPTGNETKTAPGSTLPLTCTGGGTPTPAPTPGATPTPTPSPTATGPDYSAPNVAENDTTPPELPTTDWFPALNFELGDPSCPIYSFEAFDFTHVMDSHCEFIEQYRSVLAGLFLLLFTFAAVRIVLEA